MPLGIGIWHADTSPEQTAQERARELNDVALAKKIGEHIERHYPGHWPRIEVNSEGGVIRLFIPHLLPANWGYTIKLSEFNSDPSMKCVTRGFGELLERFHQPRGRISRDERRQAAKDYASISRGVFPIELNMKTGRVRKVLPAELSR